MMQILNDLSPPLVDDLRAQGEWPMSSDRKR